MGIRFIGAVHNEIKPAQLIQIGHWNSERAGLASRSSRGRCADNLQTAPDSLRKQLKEQLRRGTGAEADFNPWQSKFERP